MKKLLTSIVVAFALVMSATTVASADGYKDPVFASAKKKKPHVVIHKRPACTMPGCDGGGTYRPTQPIAVPLAVVPPLLVFYDLQRRTNCQGDVLGLGGPGFSSPITPATGNVMTTAYMRGQCGAQPRR